MHTDDVRPIVGQLEQRIVGRLRLEPYGVAIQALTVDRRSDGGEPLDPPMVGALSASVPF